MITSMIFFPEKTHYEFPADYGFQHDDVSFQTADGVKLHGWFLEARNSRGAILFFHGNAGNISGRLYKAKGWVERGFSVFLIDYRGYGLSDGEIKQGDDILRDAHAALEWLVKSKKFSLFQIVLYGESLGTYPAIRLGAENKTAAVILEAPFTSFVDLGRLHYSLIPGMQLLLKEFAFPNQEWVSKLQAPLFILHGTRDEICPYAMGEKLFEQAPEPKGFLSIENGAHNDLPMIAGEDYWEKPFQFLERQMRENT
ncbi:MAG: alpha/beta fold hydrolase [Candidatus Omnitrophica bacterium]|nr:alpha/beta fold hydrolase [Candidatus Omnitrophota bacterium]